MSICILCTTDLASSPIVGTRERYGLASTRVACERCGLVQVDPRPSGDEIAAYYAGTIYREEHPAPGIWTLAPDGTMHVVQPTDAVAYAAARAAMDAQRVASLFEQLGLAPGARVLEIGCGDVGTLQRMIAEGLDAHGIEPDPQAAALAMERCGADRVRCGSLADVDERGAYDAVVSFHVVEHLVDPIADLRMMARMLRPGGKVWCEVPDVTRAALPLVTHWQAVHLVDFAPDTFAAVMCAAGLDARVLQSGHVLQATATPQSKPRKWSFDTLSPGALVASRLLRAEALARKVRPEQVALDLFVDGADPARLTVDIVGAIRGELADARQARAGMARILADHDAAHEALVSISQAMSAEALVSLEGWAPDPYMLGQIIGEGDAMLRASSATAHLANAIKLRELAGDGNEEAGS